MKRLQVLPYFLSISTFLNRKAHTILSQGYRSEVYTQVGEIPGGQSGSSSSHARREGFRKLPAGVTAGSHLLS